MFDWDNIITLNQIGPACYKQIIIRDNLWVVREHHLGIQVS